MPNTHYLAVVGDGHLAGFPQLIMDPFFGQKLALFSATQPVQINTIMRGATSGSVARVTKVIAPNGEFVLEMIANAFGPHVPGTGGSAWVQTPAFLGETINLDTGGTAVPSPLGDAQEVATIRGPVGSRQEAHLYTYTPEDPVTDYVFFDRWAKIASQIDIPLGTVTGLFAKGDRVQASSGGEFTVQLVTADASNLYLKAIRKTGTIAPGDTLTNLTQSGGGTIGAVEADLPIGTWVPHHTLPNLAGLAGTGTFYEFIPQGDNGGIGVYGPICRGFWQKWKGDPDPDNRGVRVVPFKTFDHFVKILCTGTFPGTWTIGETLTGLGGWTAKLVRFDVASKSLWCDQVGGAPLVGGTITGATSGATATYSGIDGGDQQPLMGGVTVQTIQCTGTFPTTWQAGETVSTPGGFVAKVQGFNAAQKWLFVTETNGQVATGTVTAATSGASASIVTGAYGWQRGSRYWTRLHQEIAEAMSRPDGLYHGQAPKWEGVILMIWETEMVMFAPTNGCPWPTVDQIRTAWRQLINDLRAQLGNPDMPIAVWHMDIRSHYGDVSIPAGGGVNFPFSFVLREALAQLPGSLPKVSLISSDGFEPAQITPLPYSQSLLHLRPDDYYELGKRAWRSLEFAEYTVPVGNNLQPLPIILMLGFSFIVGGIPASWGFGDLDPDLYPSTGFPGVNTLDVNVLNFNTLQGTWLPYDIANNANNWLGSFGFGLEASLSLRAKKRFSEDGEPRRIGLLKLAYNSATANGAVRAAPGTFDPNGAPNVTKSANCVVTVIPADSNDPARGRFTATPGTFSNFEVNAYCVVQGSLLGLQGAGGNNSPAYRGGYTRVVAADGSHVEIEGTFVPETANFTLTQGPYPLWPEVEKQIRQAFVSAIELGYLPKPVAIVTQLGVVDLERVDEFEAAYMRLHEKLQVVFGQRHKGEQAVPVIIFEDTPKTPWGVSNTDIATLIQAQRNVAAALPNAKSIDTSRLPMETGGVWPRTIRQHNGIHTTPRGYIAMGYMADAMLEQLGFPAHPDGPAMIEYGSPSLPLFGGGGGSVPLGPAGPAPGFPGTGNLIVEDGTGLDNAESLASVEDFNAFWSANLPAPYGDDTFTDEEIAAALRRATREWIRPYSGLLRGRVQHVYQRLLWPRIGCYDDEGRLVDTGTVPQDWIDATCLVAGEILAGKSVLPSEGERSQVIRETRKGASFEKTIEYAAGSGSGSTHTRIRSAEALVYGYLEGGEGVGLA